MTTATKQGISNIELDGHIDASNYSLSCEYDGDRFHIWVHKDTLRPEDTIIYRNPGDGRNFPTRTLDQGRGIGKLVTPLMLAEAPKLLLALKERLKYEEDERDAQTEYRRREHALEKAAPELLAALKELEEQFGTIAITLGQSKLDAIFKARAAIAKTEVR